MSKQKKEKQNTHRFTLRLPQTVFNAIKLVALQKGTTITKLAINTLRDEYGEVADLSKVTFNE